MTLAFLLHSQPLNLQLLVSSSAAHGSHRCRFRGKYDEEFEVRVSLPVSSACSTAYITYLYLLLGRSALPAKHGTTAAAWVIRPWRTCLNRLGCVRRA